MKSKKLYTLTEDFMMRQFKSIYSILFVLILLNACSSSDTAEESDELFEDGEEATATADTDFVPQEDMEFFDSNESKDSTASTSIPEPAATSEAPSDLGVPPSDNSFNSTQMSSTTPVGNGETVEYTVKTGDTLMKIAFQHYGDLYRWKDIYTSNKDKISDPNRISKGVTLKIEGATNFSAPTGSGEAYSIQMGDTLGKISSKVYGTPKKWKSLWENNKEMIKDPNRIYAGFNLFYSPSDGSPSMDSSSQPLGGMSGDSFQQEAPKMEEPAPAPPVTSLQETDTSNTEVRDPSSEKAKAAPAPQAQPEQLWNDDKKEEDAGFDFK